MQEQFDQNVPEQLARETLSLGGQVRMNAQATWRERDTVEGEIFDPKPENG